jgi:predicted nucleic acid-binding protein
MGSVIPTSGLVCVDANVVIYTVEKHPRYGPALRPLWTAVSAGQAQIVVSELILLESLVGPYRTTDQKLEADYETFFQLPGINLVPVSATILRGAARLRSQFARMRSPDAIHAATALSHATGNFLTNDFGFRNVPGLKVVVLDDVLSSSTNP